MKKLILMGMLLIAVNLQAQQFHLTPKVGMNIANMTNSGGANPRIGLNAGLSGEIVLNERFSLEPGVFYSMQGVKDKVSGVSEALKNDYVNVPVLGKVYAYKGLNFFAGPQVGFLVSSKESGNASGVSVDIDTKDLFKTVDFAGVLGAGYQTETGLNFSLNYNLGLINVFKQNTLNVGGQTIDVGNSNSKNNVFQINVGWRF